MECIGSVGKSVRLGIERMVLTSCHCVVSLNNTVIINPGSQEKAEDIFSRQKILAGKGLNVKQFDSAILISALMRVKLIYNGEQIKPP